MRALSAQDQLVPALIDAHEVLFQTHHVGGPSPGCDGCAFAAESAFITMFRAWERFLFDVLVSLLSGGHTKHIHRYFCHPNFRGLSVTLAGEELRRSNYNVTGVTLRPSPANYLLLNNTGKVIAISDHWISNSPVAAVFRAHATDIDRLTTIRHGLAHGTEHAQVSLRGVLAYFEPIRTFFRVGHFLLARPRGGGPMYYEAFEETLYQWSMEISP